MDLLNGNLLEKQNLNSLSQQLSKLQITLKKYSEHPHTFTSPQHLKSILLNCINIASNLQSSVNVQFITSVDEGNLEFLNSKCDLLQEEIKRFEVREKNFRNFKVVLQEQLSELLRRGKQ